MGGFFASTPQGQQLAVDDPATTAALMDSAALATGTDGDSELNVVSDVLAAQAVLSLEIPITIVPIEVASIDRAGKQSLSGNITIDAQSAAADKKASELCERDAGLEMPTMLGRMACLHRGGGAVATLDMDVIAVTTLVSKHLFQFTSSSVAVQDDGRTTLCGPHGIWGRGCQNVTLATEFDALAWVQALMDILA
eukprot:SRR837773.13337.p1 GENE.SRR837773.13337~~SRR837773.13337.p1  ORF type:complete len:209 (+),score=38.67 SRR837773.13337:43-627(+)